MNYTEMLFNRDERLVNLLNQADSKNLELIEELNDKKEEIERLNNIIKEVREYIENNWINQKDADIHRFDTEELEIEISDIAVLYEILDKETK